MTGDEWAELCQLEEEEFERRMAMGRWQRVLGGHFPEATPFGVEPREWAENPPAIHSYTFVHSTDYQSAAEIIREGQLRPTSVPPSSQEPACVLYGASTPGPPSDYTLQVCVSQLLQKNLKDGRT